MTYDQREDAYNAQQSQIKIIKRGSLPEAKIYRGECRNCGTIVEFPRGAARYSPDQRDGDMLFVVCPVCNHNITAEV